ncbi:MAG: cation diffusion facilitator family transporter [Alkalibacterium sp.]|uniref:Cation diffusion facilitator family transporter n=1 Tax=Alkalibacterium gilvum TaxID=1130080 RepID=A0A1H6VSJ5_9LACT|nr:cation diffusion facilitator family transporter [Alkalibacterium sp.]MDN6730313.1 cation diffusion facilitator family transporter [Alkalibacterium sp.]SEJ06064.1 cation diffusion facilitator family transporter [Alkalibacterium gilvum]
MKYKKSWDNLNNQIQRVKMAEQGAKVSISVYMILALAKFVVGFFLDSSSLSADGLNNLTDVLSSVTILAGLKTARKPADKNHPYGHWKAEPIASLITSFIMLFVGFQIFQNSILRFFQNELVEPNKLASIVALISSFILFILYRYNLNLAKNVNSDGLKAVARDNLADSLTSLATAMAIIGSSIGWVWLDNMMASVVAVIIIKTGIDVFRESTFSLSDGFKDKHLHSYKIKILTLDKVKEVSSIKARMYGANTYVDVTILVDGKMTVQEGHDITERIEKLLYDEFDVMHTDVHVEPDNLIKQFNRDQM